MWSTEGSTTYQLKESRNITTVVRNRPCLTCFNSGMLISVVRQREMVHQVRQGGMVHEVQMRGAPFCRLQHSLYPLHPLYLPCIHFSLPLLLPLCTPLILLSHSHLLLLLFFHSLHILLLHFPHFHAFLLFLLHFLYLLLLLLHREKRVKIQVVGREQGKRAVLLVVM